VPVPEIVEVDPRTLYLPPSRRQGADPFKLARQIARHGTSIAGMPRPWVIRGKDGKLRIHDGVTRATRVAQLLPGQTIQVEVVDTLPNLDVTLCPTIGDLVP
jgi:hypothetical protein